MNNKGFTMVELIVSFTLTSIIVIILFQLIISLKEMQEYADTKTELLTKQATISRRVNKFLTNEEIIGITNCENESNCIKFNSTKRSLELSVDRANNIIKIDNDKISLVKNSKIDDVVIDNNPLNNINDYPFDSIFSLKISIKHKYFKDEEFGLYSVFQYKYNDVTIGNLTLN